MSYLEAFKQLENSKKVFGRVELRETELGIIPRLRLK